MPGQCTSDIEVSVASSRGFWLLVGDEELYLPFELFPWFRQATLQEMMQVERYGEQHLYWPLLDLDLSLESIREPDRFPLVAA